MRASIAALTVCAVLLPGTLAAAAATHGTFAEAKALAAERGVPLLLDFYTQT
jgi:hypothetical protein